MKFLTPLAMIMLLAANTGQAQVLAEWVENDPANDPNKLALGYPVPIPVNTPVPFDGFRTYSGLHARHQDLAATTPWVHPENIGTTLQGRTIWAYRLGDEDRETLYGAPEPATLANGGIHAREWQTPEVVTGLMELMATHEDDNHFYDYLRDNVNMIVIPSLNIDGFLQTQRFPAENYLQSDPNFPATSPRDGRMRRKNMRGADEMLATVGDHLQGIDLNRNNSPFWATSGSSSPDSRLLTHHGASPQSEPETQALDAAAALGPADQLRIYTDVHSFSQVHFWSRNTNVRLGALTSQVLNLFTEHHAAFPAGKYYLQVAPTINAGIGTTAEYFTYQYQVPAWTLEVEPSQGAPYHPTLPGNGADYGGVVENGHDGFILPESQIRRVREQLAQTFAAVYYRQAGPPSVQSMRFVDKETNAVVFEAEWDTMDEFNRSLYSHQLQPLQLDRDYVLWLSYNKPMRWREGGEVVPFPGLGAGFLTAFSEVEINGQRLNKVEGDVHWLDMPGDAPGGYLNYEDDAVAMDIRFPRDFDNDSLLSGSTDAVFTNLTWDMTASVIDANPATRAYWANGNWNNLENTAGNLGDFGGKDSTISLQVTDEELPPPFVLEPGTAAAWGDVDRVGEGFILEMLPNNLAVMFWFTNNDEGGQDWYIGVGEVRGNRMLFPEVLRVSGGVFGDDFDPELVTEEVVGSAKFIWTDCDTGFMDWQIGPRHGRQNLSRLTRIAGLDCGPPILGLPVGEEVLFSGSWGDPSHDGEGFTVEILTNATALVFWFSFGPDGKRRWYFGIGRIEGTQLIFDELLTTVGGFFGENLVPENVDEVPWGSLVLDLACDGGTATYVPTEAGFEPGQQNVLKLTNMPGLECTL